MAVAGTELRPSSAGVGASARLIVIVICGASVAVGAAAAFSRGLSPASAQGLRVLAAVILLVAAVATARRAAGPWLAIASGAVLALTTIASGPDSMHRTSGGTLTFLLTYCGLLLLPRVWGPAWIAAGVVLWWLVVGATPLWITIGDTELNVRWMQGIQLGVSAAWLWLVVDSERGRLRRLDEERQRSDGVREAAIAYQERIRVWRASAVHAHETVLNDIRYVLSGGPLERERLGEHLAQRFVEELPAPPPSPSLESIVSGVAAREQLQGRLAFIGHDVTLPAPVSDALRSGLTEAIRNAMRHAGASEFSVACEPGSTATLIRVRHDGSAPAGRPHEGMGTRIVLREHLEAAGIAMLPAEGGLDLIVLESAAPAEPDTGDSTDTARLFLSTITAGNAVGGLLFGLVLMLSSGPAAWAAGVAFAATVALGAAGPARRATLHPIALWLLAAFGAAVPLLAAAGVTCGNADVVRIVAVLTGYVLIAGLLWAPGPRYWWLALGWAAALVVCFGSTPPGCQTSASPDALSAFAPILALGVSYLTLRRTARQEADARSRAQDEARELAAAAAKRDLAVELGGAVEEASALMRSIAAGSPLDDAAARSLRCLDAEIRASLQVDLETAGGMSLAGRALAISAARADIPVKVLSLHDSGDRRPIDSNLLADLRAVLMSSLGGLSIAVISAADRDLMMITVARSAAGRSPITTNSHTYADVTVEIAEADGEGDAVIIVERELRQTSPVEV